MSEVLQKLLNPDVEGFEDSWNQFFMDVQKVREIGSLLTPQLAQQLLVAGQAWKGTGWNTSKASKTLFTLTGVPLVKSTWQDYRNSFLYALSLFYEVDVQELDLTDRSADAAFNLCQVFSGAVDSTQDYQMDNYGSNPSGGNFLPTQPSETEASEEDFVLPWDEPRHNLPQELAYIWQGVVQGERRLDLKAVLGPLPKYKELPQSAPVNNHRLDSARKADKKERAWQQLCLHGMRILSAGYGDQAAANSVQLQQQLFQLLAELYIKLESSRKDMSIPGCVPHAGDVLFQNEELKNALQVRRINRFGKGMLPIKCGYSPSSMPSFPGKGSFGKGYGSYSSFGKGQFGYGSRYGKGVPRWQGKGKGKCPDMIESTVPSPLPHPHLWSQRSLSAFYRALRQRLCWWRAHAASHIQEVIAHGILKPPQLSGPLSCVSQYKNPADVLEAQSIMLEYSQVGAVKLHSGPRQDILHLVPWFIIKKEEKMEKRCD